MPCIRVITFKIMWLIWLGQLLGFGYSFCPLRNCIKCTDVSNGKICDTCALGHYIDPTDNVCLPCSTRVPNCNRCNSDGTTCYSCDAGRILKTTTKGKTVIQECLLSQEERCKAVPHCGLCTITDSTTTCEACMPGYALQTQSNSCVVCSGNCVYCSTGSTCEFCEDNYALSSQSSTCTKCNINNCDICHDASVCNTCSDGFHHNDDGTCVQNNQCDIVGCKACNQGKSICTECYKGYYLTGKTCTPCSDGIPNCILCSETSITTSSRATLSCQKCQLGYNLRDYVCESCADLTMHCQHCPSGVCTSCEPGYQLVNYPRYCKQITTKDCSNLKNCLTCTSDIKCVSCKPGYSPKDGQCVLYTGCGVTNCGVCKTSEDTCDFCVRGYRLEGNQCIKKCEDRNCHTCNTGTDGKEVCSECMSGYTVDAATGLCTSCGIKNCAQCSVSTKTKGPTTAPVHKKLSKWLGSLHTRKAVSNQPNRIEDWDEKLKTIARYYNLTETQLTNLRVVLYDYFTGGSISTHLFNDSATIMSEISRLYINKQKQTVVATFACLECEEGYTLTHNTCVRQTLTTSNIVGITAGVVLAVGIIAGAIAMTVISKRHR